MSKKAFFEENGWSIVNLLNDTIVFKLSLECIKSFCSCSLNEISTISLNEDKANAHADMPVWRYVSVCCTDISAGLWSYGQRATALSGRGSFAFIVQGCREPRLGKCNDLRPFFLYSQKSAK